MTVDAHRVEFETDWPPWHAAAYLLDGDEPLLVDAGVPGESGWETLTSGLAERGLDPEAVEHVLVTHPHTDHDGLVGRLVEAADPAVYTLRAARDRLGMDTDALAERIARNARAAGLGEEAADRYVAQAVDSVERNRACFPPEAVHRALEPGETFRAGDWEFRVVHTPGHQRDHACYATDEALFAGDQVIEPFRAAALNVGLDDGVVESVDEFYEGYRRLSGRSFETVYPGHGPVFRDFSGAVERSVESLDRLVSEVAGTLDTHAPATALSVDRARAAGDRDYTLFETVGALGYLTDRGEATFRVREGVRYYEA
jgi:glyoxylase-like metal-dependent hydrolase (beta-lactamase superfamily II)